MPTARKKKVPVEFERDDDNAPILNSPSQMMARAMEPMVRRFMSIHYSESVEIRQPVLFYNPTHLDISSNGKKAAVDWTALSEHQNEMIDPEYLPARFIFRDPSKMKKVHYQALLEHWYRRQEDDAVDTAFAFKGYWDASTDSVTAVTMRKSKGTRKANMPKIRPGPPGIRRSDVGWQNVGEDADGEGDGEDEEDEEDSGEDEEDSGEDEEEEEDDGNEEDNAHRRGAQSKSKVPQPMELPFSAKHVFHAAPVVPRRSAPKQKASAQNRVKFPSNEEPNTRTTVSKSKNGNSSKSQSRSTTNNIKPPATKRPQPRPAYRRVPEDAAALQASPTLSAPQPVKETRARKLLQPPALSQYERPTTRSGVKRKADDGGLQLAVEPSTKRAKRGETGKVGRKSSRKK